jgi:hypothetical protein
MKILNEKGILQRVELKVCGEREAGLFRLQNAASYMLQKASSFG